MGSEAFQLERAASLPARTNGEHSQSLPTVMPNSAQATDKDVCMHLLTNTIDVMPILACRMLHGL
jgi:hypothetical protein